MMPHRVAAVASIEHADIIPAGSTVMATGLTMGPAKFVLQRGGELVRDRSVSYQRHHPLVGTFHGNTDGRAK